MKSPATNRFVSISKLFEFHSASSLAMYIAVNLFVLTLALFSAKGQPVWRNIADGYNQTKDVIAPVYKIETERVLQAVSQVDLFYASLSESSDPAGLLSETLLMPHGSRANELSKPALLAYVKEARRLINEILSIGYIEKPLASESSRVGFIIISSRNSNRETPLDSLITRNTLNDFLNNKLKNYTPEAQDFIISVVRFFLQENLYFSHMERHTVSALSLALSAQEYIGVILYFFLTAFIVLLLIHKAEEQSGWRTPPMRYNIALILGLVAIALSFFIIVAPILPYMPRGLLVPIALFSMIFTLLYNRTIAAIFAFYFSMVFSLNVGFDPFSSIYIWCSSLCAIYFADRSDTRLSLLGAALQQGLCQCLILLILTLLTPAQEIEPARFAIVFLSGAGSAVVSLGILPVFELIMNIPTRYRLLELSSLNAPMLRRLQAIAPGTYNHSLNVAALAENACNSVDANGLLARVGAYYHDLGKIENPDFFVENQTGENKHDDMKPALSAAMIRAHVKIGVERARELHLPLEIIDIIEQHHGKSLVSYFYNRAKVEAEGKEAPLKADFMYFGPWPQTIEAGIVALADGVEAASHTLKRPTVAKLETFVWSIIMQRVDEGFLRDCNLTMNQLDKVKEAFVHALTGQYHSRIEYPDPKKESANA